MKNIDKYLDNAFSIYTRLEHTDEYGIGYCYTCNKRITYKSAECGHYVRRKEMATRWNVNNGKIQCNHCNCALHGNLIEYRERLINENGIDFLLDLENQGRANYKMSLEEKKGILLELRNHIRQLLKNKMFGI